MRLSKIKLSGFKSFVDSTTIAFPGNLMGIVGPNGCGKSNVIDAVRWVLGEGSAKTLRGDSMADVIFDGSSVRKPVGRASVELIFNNADGTLSGPYAGYSEVAVRRVVSRDGTSKYFLNNSRCRRKDITHLLLGTGLGAHGYSIIEQGMISRLVEAKPEDLRAFLEEAAGISKYKERRRETENRIRRTRENLDRLSDLREEVAKQLSHLQRQARAAERFKALRSEQRRMEAELLALRLSALQEDFGARRIHKDEKQTRLDAALAAQRATEAGIEELRLELDEGNNRHGEIRGRILEADSQISRLEHSLENRRKLRQRWQEGLEQVAGELEENRSLFNSDSADIRQIDRLLGELGPDLERFSNVHKTSTDELREAERAWENSQDQWGRVIEVLADAERTEQIQLERLEYLDAQRQRVQQERGQLADEGSEQSADRLRERLSTLADRERSMKGTCDDASNALANMWRQLQSLRETESDIGVKLDRARRQQHEQRGRLTSLEALQEAAASPASSEVVDWLRSNHWLTRPRYADSLVVDTGWETAVETVLSDYLQAVCVKGIDEAAPRFSQLTKGRLTLWENGIDRELPRRSPERMLCRFVQGPGVGDLLKGVYAASTVVEALEMRQRLEPHESVVTRDGLWMGPRWIRIKRGADPQAGMLSRADEIKRLRKGIDSHAERVRELENALDEVGKDLEKLEAERAQAQLDAADGQQRYADVKSELEAGRSRLEECVLRDRAAQQRTVEIDAELDDLAVRTLASEDELDAARVRREELTRARTKLESRRDERRRQLDDVRAQEEQSRADVQRISLRIESERSAKESALGALDRVRTHREHLRRRRRELQSEIQGAVEPTRQEEQALNAQLETKLDIKERLDSARLAVEDVEARLNESKFLHADQERMVDGAREALEEARLNIREVEVRIEAVSTDLSKTGFDADRLLETLSEDASVPARESSLERLERRIRQIGSVNLAAIDELERHSERKQYLDAQFADLNKALETLENAIRKIDRETRTRFDETFKAANVGLARLFPRLYGGGHAYLELNGDDLLTSGVTVMARPPGKRVSTIHLLSGGEKALTAVALVFSIFELNPAPFCLLDEVDAPLDDANVGRFAEIVGEMSEQVQFVLITHNKTTMESMQQLTGVTMSEPGVSRLVAVDIDEAVQLAAV